MSSHEVQEALTALACADAITRSVVVKSYLAEDWAKLARFCDWMLSVQYRYSPRVEKAAQVLATHARGEYFRKYSHDLVA